MHLFNKLDFTYDMLITSKGDDLKSVAATNRAKEFEFIHFGDLVLIIFLY